jgi:hypothetical protein
VTITLKLQEAVLLAASVAVHVTVVSPALKATLLSVLPVPVVAPASVYESETPEQLSMAVASHPVPLWTYLHALLVPAFCCTVTGQLTDDGILSFTVTVNEHGALLLPEASLAV